MTFTTIRGTGGAADTFAGSNGVDTIGLVNPTSFFLYGAQANDVVTLNVAFQGAISGATANGGSGDDTLNFVAAGAQTAFSGGSVNGNQGDDTITFAQLISATAQGGQGTDTMAINSLSGAYINGNKAGDVITIGNNNAGQSVVSASQIRAGADSDTIRIQTGADAVTNSSFYGDEGNDTIINLLGGITGTWTNSTVFGGNGSDTINLANVAGTTANLFISGDGGNDTVTTAAGSDTVLGGDGNDTITTSTSADSMSGGAGNDIFVIAQGDSVVATANTFTAGANPIAAGNTLTFGGGVDIITDFTAGANNDVLNVTTAATAPTSLLTGNGGGAFNTNTALTAGTTYFVSGTYSGNTFTLAANGTGPDTLIVDATNVASAAQTGWTVLKGVNSGLLVAGNFT